MDRGGVESTKKVNKNLREEIISQAGICRKNPETKALLACQRNREEAECVPKDKERQKRRNHRGRILGVFAGTRAVAYTLKEMGNQRRLCHSSTSDQ